MRRAHLYRPIQDGLGNLRTGAQVRVFDVDSTTLTSIPLFASDIGTATIPHVFVATNGVIEFYTDEPERFRLGVKVGDEPEILFENVDCLSAEPPPPPPPEMPEPFVLPEPFDLVGTEDLAYGSGSFVYTTIPAFRRGLVWRLDIDAGSATTWGFRVTSLPDGAGELMFEALGIGQALYHCSWPWMFENHGDAAEMHIGVTTSGGPTTVTLLDVRAEVFKA